MEFAEYGKLGLYFEVSSETIGTQPFKKYKNFVVDFKSRTLYNRGGATGAEGQTLRFPVLHVIIMFSGSFGFCLKCYVSN